MNTRLFGLIAGSVGILFLFVAVILGAVIGANEQTQREYWFDDESVSEDDYDKASETIAFLTPVNKGVAGFGMGFLFMGIGLALASNKRGNMLVIGIAAAAVLILIIGMILSIYIGAISKEMYELGNKENPSESDGDRAKEITKRLTFLNTFNNYFSGFIFGSLGMGLALATTLAGAFVRAGSDKKSEEFFIEEKKEDPFPFPSTQGSMTPPSYPPQNPPMGGYNPNPPSSQMDQIFQ